MRTRLAMADDQELILQGLSMMLEGCADVEIVLKSLGGKDLLKRIREEAPDVLLLDIQMPGVSGIDLCREINREEPFIRIIALTNFDEIHYVKQMLRNGARGYLLKNTDRETLLRAIGEVCADRLFLDEQIHQQVVGELARERGPRGAVVHLTKREKEILKLIAEEYSNRQIADRLFISLRTVETHRLNLTQKLDVKNTAGLVKEAMRLGLL